MMKRAMSCRKRLIGSILYFILVLFCHSADSFDHSYVEYGKILTSFVNNGRVHYSALQKNRATLDEFIQQIRSVQGIEYQSWTREQQLAFWINTYNGWFLQIVIDRYPIRGSRLYGLSYPENSVQRIPGIWDNIKLKTAGREISLNDLEHKVLRPIFHEPRIHFAIVCASLGCPSLSSEPYQASSIESQLDKAAQDFVTDPSKVSWETSTKTLKISRIFDWFSDDFSIYADESLAKLYSKKQAGVVSFILRYLAVDELRTKKVKIAYLEYDWALNDVR